MSVQNDFFADPDELGEAVDRGSGGKNVIFSNCPYGQSKYSDPLIYVPI